MRTIDDLFDEYAASHCHPTNIALHKISVPVIYFCVLGLLWQVPLQFTPYRFINVATLATVIALAYYLRLSRRLGIGMAVSSGFMLALIARLDLTLDSQGLAFYGTIFAVAWVFQFIGHKIEGRKPAFFKDLQFLLIGPLWVLESFYAKVGLNRR